MKCLALSCIPARLSKELGKLWGVSVTRLTDWIDLPPMWLALSLGVVWAFDQIIPWALFGPGGRVAGGVLVALGLGLMAAAVLQMVMGRTTVIPRRAPAALIRTGVFSVTRNPIYLGDALVLAGAILWWDVAVGLPILLAFMALIQHRFILPEEDALRVGFGPAYQAWAARVPRWIGW